MSWDNPDPNDKYAYPTGLNWDPRLTDFGYNQSRELSQYFVVNNIKIDRIYSSPLYRAVETANIIAEKINFRYFSRKCEWCSPRINKLNAGCAPLPLLREFFPRINPTYISISKLPDINETSEELHERLSRTIQGFIEVKEDIRSILIISHATSTFTGVRALIKQIYAMINCATCSLTKCIRNGGNWEIELNGDTSFLSHGSVRNWVFKKEWEDNYDVKEIHKDNGLIN
ncbi:12045_t:CDS:2 [Dentiscutata erythropus]|uniref:12045_t:CDS:1 n=1 Tax=Dentiscutata erythropus TaxID=1348616 RepID=A0A9N9IH39_9GLOM|nr:12045_t:CDS:2 [Dentiscutata erythropus]